MHYSIDTTIVEIADATRKSCPTEHMLMLQFGDCTIKVLANKPEITSSLNEYFGPFVIDATDSDIEITVHEIVPPTFETEFTVKQPDPGKTKIKEEFIDFSDGRIVRKRLTEMIFVFGNGTNLAIGPCMDNLNQVVNFVNNRYIEWELSKGSLLGHAAAVTWKGQGIAMAGFSGAGKSTLSLHLMSKGTDFVSNDRLMVNLDGNDLVMRGVAKLPRINPGTILNNKDLIGILSDEEKAEFLELPKEELWQLEHKFDVPIDQCFGDSKFYLKAPMKLLVLLNWKREEGETFIQEVDLSERQDLLPAFMKSTGLFFCPAEDSHVNPANNEDYVDVLKHCRVIEISGSIDFEKATQACLSIIEKDSL